MIYRRLVGILSALTDPQESVEAYRQLGVPLAEHRWGRQLTVNEDQPFSIFFVDAPTLGDSIAAAHASAVAAGRPCFGIVLEVHDLPKAVESLTSRGVPAIVLASRSMAWLPIEDLAGMNIALIPADAVSQNVGELTFPLRRMDHLAAVAPDFDVKTRFWTDTLGVPLGGEVTSPNMNIRQFRFGEAVVELLGASSPESPIHSRPPGLLSMTSWEVPRLNEAFILARERGFIPSDPATGVLPGTRIATIPAQQLGGVNMQLLEYVKM